MASLSLRTRILNLRSQTTDEAVRRQAALFQEKPELCRLLDSLPHPLLILNSERHIVFANRVLLNTLGAAESGCVHGLRPGEVLDCDHAWNDCAGCGMTEACRLCGAAQAITSAQKGAEATQECRILQTDGTALDLRAVSTPFTFSGESFTILSLTDISNEKRRKVLERVFFHDLLNMTASLMGYTELLSRVSPDEVPDISALLVRMVRELAEEIRAQRDLTLAETHDLKVRWEPVCARKTLAAVADACRSLDAAEGCTILLDPATAEVTFPSDKALLSRVLGNMLKNALEASAPGGTVKAGCNANSTHVEFWVHNDGEMPRDVQLQVFQRSFSTKGSGRGLGTYSIKLLTERYLHGQAGFVSTSDAGTTFTVTYPLTQPEGN